MLYLIRHGTTDQRPLRDPGDLTPATPDEWAADHALSEGGRDEARLLGARLVRLDKPDRLLSSPRRRALETATLAVPGWVPLIDADLDEWHAGEPEATLYARVCRLLTASEEGTTLAFTHGGFIRAVVAALVVRGEEARFSGVFHDLRRVLHVWNCSLTLVGHGGSGLEVLAVNLHPSVDALSGGHR